VKTICDLTTHEWCGLLCSTVTWLTKKGMTVANRCLLLQRPSLWSPQACIPAVAAVLCLNPNPFPALRSRWYRFISVLPRSCFIFQFGISTTLPTCDIEVVSLAVPKILVDTARIYLRAKASDYSRPMTIYNCALNVKHSAGR